MTELNFPELESILLRGAVFILFLGGVLRVILPEVGYVYRLCLRKKIQANNQLEESSVNNQ